MESGPLWWTFCNWALGPDSSWLLNITLTQLQERTGRHSCMPLHLKSLYARLHIQAVVIPGWYAWDVTFSKVAFHFGSYSVTVTTGALYSYHGKGVHPCLVGHSFMLGSVVITCLRVWKKIYNCMPVVKRIQFNSILLFYRCLNGCAPLYLTS